MSVASKRPPTKKLNPFATRTVPAYAAMEKIWQRTLKALNGGDFSLLDKILTEAGVSIVDLLEANGEPIDAMHEAFAWACFTGRTDEAEMLLDKGLDPGASDKTGLSGFHWAANRGNVETVRMLIRRNAPLEQLNMYGGTVLGQTLWSAVNEPRPGQSEIIELLIAAGAAIEHGTLDWWNQQQIASPDIKKRVAAALESANIS
jgi:hypothetical protein